MGELGLSVVTHSVPRDPADSIPRIDIAPLVEGPIEAREARAVTEKLRNACSDIGFMTVTGHGIPRDVTDGLMSAARTFFALPDTTKLESASRKWNPESPNVYRGYFPSSADGKEGLDIGEPRFEAGDAMERPYHEPNRLPASLGSDWSNTLEQAFDALSALGATLMKGLVAALGGDAARVAPAFARPAALSTLRFNFYPDRVAPHSVSNHDGAGLCCESHVDSGLLTLLYQDDRGGLQVRGADGRWQDVPPDPDAFVVNTGLAMHRMTDGALAATRHRVLHQPGMRISLPFFFEPVPDFVMSPASLGLPFESKPNALSYEAFLQRSLEKFPEYAR